MSVRAPNGSTQWFSWFAMFWVRSFCIFVLLIQDILCFFFFKSSKMQLDGQQATIASAREMMITCWMPASNGFASYGMQLAFSWPTSQYLAWHARHATKITLFARWHLAWHASYVKPKMMFSVWAFILILNWFSWFSFISCFNSYSVHKVELCCLNVKISSIIHHRTRKSI